MPQRAATPPLLDLVFKALADPTRRAVVERLGNGPLATSELARPFTMTLPSFTEHLGVLERCGLVTSQKHGRVRTYRLAPERLADASHWLEEQREVWERRLDQLDDYLTATMPDPEMPSPEMPSPEMPSPEMPSPEMPSPEMPSPKMEDR